MTGPSASSPRRWLLRPTSWAMLAGVCLIALLVWVFRPPPPQHPHPAPFTGTPNSRMSVAGLSASGTVPANAAPAASVPRFDIARISPDGNAVIAGQAQPHARVTILDGDQPLGQAQADAHGAFVFLPNAPLLPGTRALRLQQRGPDGAQTQGTEQVILLVPPRPTRDSPTGDISTPPALALLTAPEAAPRLLQTPLPPIIASADGRAARGRLGIDVVDYDATGDIRFAGSAPAGAVLRVYVDNQPIGTTTADAAGKWSFQAPGRVPAGDHPLRLDHLTANGEVRARVELMFRREAQLALPVGATAGGATAGGVVVVQPGDSLWLLARQNYGEGLRYTAIHAANSGQIKDPNLIYPGQIFTMPPTPAHGGNTAGGNTAGGSMGINGSSTESSSRKSR